MENQTPDSNGIGPSRVSLRIPARPDYIQPIHNLAEKLISVWSPSAESKTESFEILLALQETVTNVIRHGYKGQSGDIEIEFRFLNHALEIEIHDWGVPFDPNQVPAPNFEEPKPGGYGVYIVKKVTDEISFRREGDMNIAQLMKRFPKDNKPPEVNP